MNSYFMLILSQVMLGSVAIFARWVKLPADVIVLFRCLFAAISIGTLLFFSQSIKEFLKPGKTLMLLTLTGLFMASNWYFFFKAVLTTTITNTILLYNFAPIFVLISAIIFLKEIPTVRQVICVASSIVGVFIILNRNSTAGVGSFDLGCLFALAAGALYSQVTIIGRYLKSVPALVITLFQTSVGAFMFAPLSFGHLQKANISSSQMLILITMGIFHTAIPYLMYFKALKSLKATVAGILQYVYTLSTIIFGMIFFKESVTPPIVIGGLLILVSSYIALKMPGKTPIKNIFLRKTIAMATSTSGTGNA